MLKADALAHFKSQRAIADLLDISEAAVSQWDRLVPEGSAYKLHALSNGAVPIRAHLYTKLKRSRKALSSRTKRVQAKSRGS